MDLATTTTTTTTGPLWVCPVVAQQCPARPCWGALPAPHRPAPPPDHPPGARAKEEPAGRPQCCRGRLAEAAAAAAGGRQSPSCARAACWPGSLAAAARRKRRLQLQLLLGRRRRCCRAGDPWSDPSPAALAPAGHLLLPRLRSTLRGRTLLVQQARPLGLPRRLGTSVAGQTRIPSCSFDSSFGHCAQPRRSMPGRLRHRPSMQQRAACQGCQARTMPHAAERRRLRCPRQRQQQLGARPLAARATAASSRRAQLAAGPRSSSPQLAAARGRQPAVGPLPGHPAGQKGTAPSL